MSITTAICYLDTDGKVVGLNYESTQFNVKEGTVTEITKPYPFTRVFPIEFLLVDAETGDIRVYTHEEVVFMASVEEGEIARDAYIEAEIIVHDGVWKMLDKDRANIQDGIDEAAMANLPDDFKQNWIMANGSIFEATPLKLAQVLSAYRARKQAIYNEYIGWLQSGASGEFTSSVTNTYTF